ncbi:DUF393 domain-containing protein [Halobacillus litoralis]|uniref:DCC1-like thiol-disulfide oxidoreductase family protein n=1 Tax=Halobacillus litoralis TaxID=45668 RepID=UPI001CD555EC|nr:DUF393 domain-containing protein [Halobacillus litoralis]MCA0970893.1 DUF393 domain-containing protein [Halobacillus litoralis]
MQHLTVYYDGNCPLCKNTVMKWRKLDKRRRIDFVSFRDPHINKALPFKVEVLEQEMCSYSSLSQSYYWGLQTFIQVHKNIPLLHWTVPLLLMAEKLRLGDHVYRFIASKRKIQTNQGTCNDSCSIK